MLNWIITGIIGALAIAGSFFPQQTAHIWDDVRQFGAISYPASLDNFTNPSGTDSVATVSHSAQHSNANDAIEALQAKLGIGASTSLANTLLCGNGTGSSYWCTHATGTEAYFTNYIATGSTTLQNFTFLNATGTSATTTNSYSTTASSSDLYSTTFTGGGLSTCNGSSFLQWAGGTFGCNTSGGVQVFSTTTQQQLATTTISSTELPDTDNLIIKFISPTFVGSGATTTTTVWLAFNYNEDSAGGAYGYTSLTNVTNQGEVNVNYVQVVRDPDSGNHYPMKYFTTELTNLEGLPKFGTFTGFDAATTTGAINLSVPTHQRIGSYTWATTTKATSISIWPNKPNVLFATGTQITIMGY